MSKNGNLKGTMVLEADLTIGVSAEVGRLIKQRKDQHVLTVEDFKAIREIVIVRVDSLLQARKEDEYLEKAYIVLRVYGDLIRFTDSYRECVLKTVGLVASEKG